MMDDELLLASELLFENLIGLLWSLGSDDADTVHNPVHVGINSDIRRIIEHR
ncbi:MAG: hypothetical protein ACD_78C00145G0001 [uncultured bacterium (gcode 4)]|uniref:Uncharacterized protein n=1 Tax=uncultured bacterium (gcode 4) TaxID=1234023 RepID=K1YXQ2_9BACT|nr:MAG: hypothetical protein ACD_78C00145G0001 [uncultured bacterium (gcode 4)]